MRLITKVLLTLLWLSGPALAREAAPLPIIAAQLPADVELVQPPAMVDLGPLGRGQVVLYLAEGDYAAYQGLVALPQPEGGWTVTSLPHERTDGAHYETEVTAILAADLCQTGRRALVVLQRTWQTGNTIPDAPFGIAYLYQDGRWTVHAEDAHGGVILRMGTAAEVRAALRRPTICAALQLPGQADQ